MRPIKIKGLFVPFGLKIGRVGRSILVFPPLNLNTGPTEKMYYHSCVCILRHAELPNWFNPGVGGGCIPLHLVITVRFWDSYYIFWHFILTFCLKMQNWKSVKKKKKKRDPYFLIFWGKMVFGLNRANRQLFFRPDAAGTDFGSLFLTS